MIKPDAPSTMRGLACSEVKAELSSIGELNLNATIQLLNGDGAVMGQSKLVGPWPPAVIEALRTLQDAMEEHAASVLFAVTSPNDDASPVAPGEDIKPSGLFPKGDPPQL